ncbi:MAG: carboxypeptidase regulatory-like domain-containing protein [Gemmatimonadaceae bacterium]|nr:carboxypeptidase regulatory-like domain-containing protein [Gemmatimonadaceae bacterium]
MNAILLCASRADAQSMAQGLSGVVHDNANRGIASATVEVRNTETGYLVRTSTTATGRYAVLGLPVGGPYTVRARRVGYEPSERTGITLTTGSRVQVDLTLGTSGTRLGTVNVSATQDSMRNDARNDGRNARMGGSTRITRAQLDALPVADRNLAELATLSPLAGPQLSLAGQRWTSTDIRFDGAQARNQLRAGELNGGPTAISLEAVREFEVNTALYDAALGRQGGGQLTAVTRSGTNLPEARLFVGVRNTSLAAPRDFAGRSRALVCGLRAVRGAGSADHRRREYTDGGERRGNRPRFPAADTRHPRHTVRRDRHRIPTRPPAAYTAGADPVRARGLAAHSPKPEHAATDHQ